MSALRLTVAAVHVGVIVGVAAGCFLLPIPLGLLVLAGRNKTLPAPGYPSAR